MLTDENLKKVEEFAGYFFSPADIVLIIGIDAKYLLDEKFITAYKRGKLIKEAAIRKSVIELAVGGSSPAQLAALKIIDQSKLDEAN
jgi:hypothetical protein